MTPEWDVSSDLTRLNLELTGGIRLRVGYEGIGGRWLAWVNGIAVADTAGNPVEFSSSDAAREGVMQFAAVKLVVALDELKRLSPGRAIELAIEAALLTGIRE